MPSSEPRGLSIKRLNDLTTILLYNNCHLIYEKIFIMLAVQIELRSAFLKYLLEPNKNETALKKASFALCGHAISTGKRKAKKDSKEFGVDEINTVLEPLVIEAVKGICITQEQLVAIQNFKESLFTKNRVEAATFDSVFDPLIETLASDKRIVDNKYHHTFAAIYPIELDGYRIKEKDKEAGQAALTLSKSLMDITLGICKKDSAEQHDKDKYEQAYINAEGHGIDKHRGFKEKFYNFCRILSCVFIKPYFHYKAQPSFWTTVKTKTQEDIDKSHETINAFFKNNKTC
ncbi:Uncharacterised protein [Legionella cherrii]|uniref:Substrate of the Dot/Icm secretion system n=2 Tax=Legionella cherrii TaxID=28084 RepID=A0ABY6TCH5_9GAMM|nr:Uncharacterised protein [Legionella cherrii]